MGEDSVKFEQVNCRNHGEKVKRRNEKLYESEKRVEQSLQTTCRDCTSQGEYLLAHWLL